MSSANERLSLLGSYGPWAYAVASRPGELSFSRTVPRGSMDLSAWKRAGRARLLDALGPLPTEAAPAFAPVTRTLRSYRFDGLEVEELTWQLPYGPPTEATLLKPAGVRGPLPGVLALHDHGGVKRFGKEKIARIADATPRAIAEHRQRYYDGVAWANELAHRGFAVLAHDVFPFGSRRVEAAQVPAHVVERLLADPALMPPLTAQAVASGRSLGDVDVLPDDPPEQHGRYEAFSGRHEDVLARSLFALGFSLPGVTLAEDLAALHVLAHRPDIDPTRLGCCGLSGGGLRTCFLSGLNDSIRCAVTAGFMSTWRDFALWNSYIHTWALFVPQLSRALDFPEILGLRAPLPSLVLACDGDLLFDQQEVLRAEAQLGTIYQKAGASDRARTSHHPYPHCFNLPMQAEAFDWLGFWLAPGRT